jgi:hypothetical protein
MAFAIARGSLVLGPLRCITTCACFETSCAFVWAAAAAFRSQSMAFETALSSLRSVVTEVLFQLQAAKLCRLNAEA